MKLHLSFGTRTVPILDIVHALAYVWEAAGLLEKDEGRRRAFTRERLLRILRGEIQGVIKGLRRLGTTHALKGETAKDLARINDGRTTRITGRRPNRPPHRATLPAAPVHALVRRRRGSLFATL